MDTPVVILPCVIDRQAGYFQGFDAWPSGTICRRGQSHTKHLFSVPSPFPMISEIARPDRQQHPTSSGCARFSGTFHARGCGTERSSWEFVRVRIADMGSRSAHVRSMAVPDIAASCGHTPVRSHCRVACRCWRSYAAPGSPCPRLKPPASAGEAVASGNRVQRGGRQ